MSDLTYMKAPWFATLKAEAKERSITAVAEELGVSRTTVSLVLSGKYQGGTHKVAERVGNLLGGFNCLYDGTAITPSECRSTAQAEAPTHNPAKLAQWSACQRCPKNQKGGV